jgi:hypothetical protein
MEILIVLSLVGKLDYLMLLVLVLFYVGFYVDKGKCYDFVMIT